MKTLAMAAAAVVAFAMTGASANAAAPIAYTYALTNVPASGFGGWFYDADTLNDGIIPTTQNDDMLLDTTANPSITFTFSNFYKISSIQVLSAYLSNNYIPGNIYSATVTIGANSANIISNGFGAINPRSGFFGNEDFTLPTALASLSTNTFTLSNFVSTGAYSQYASLGEVVVNGAVAAPEPATWGLMILGFGSAGVMLRRRRQVASAA